MASDYKWFIISIFVQTWRLIRQLYHGKVLFCYELGSSRQLVTIWPVVLRTGFEWEFQQFKTNDIELCTRWSVCGLRGAWRGTVVNYCDGVEAETYIYAICIVCYFALLCRVEHSIIAIYFEVRHPRCVGSVTKEFLCTTQAV